MTIDQSDNHARLLTSPRFSSIISLPENSLAIPSIRSPQNPHRVTARFESSNRAKLLNEIARITGSRKDEEEPQKKRKRCSITVDQVFVKSGRLVGHRRAKPSGSLVPVIAWLDACDARRGRGWGRWWFEAAAAALVIAAHVEQDPQKTGIIDPRDRFK